MPNTLPPYSGELKGVRKYVRKPAMTERKNPYEAIPESHWNRARALRRQATVAEKKLWHHLRRYSTQYKFRRQHPIGPFIVDFYAPDLKLVLEIDGDSHAGHEAEEYDARRTAFLRNQGCSVVRFTNRDVLNSIEGVMAAIHERLDKSGEQSPNPL